MSTMEPPYGTYGFTYGHNGKRFALHIVAANQAEAESRLAAMQAAICVGQLSPVGENTTDAGLARLASR